jgi:hypothetical protein
MHWVRCACLFPRHCCFWHYSCYWRHLFAASVIAASWQLVGAAAQ